MTTPEHDAFEVEIKRVASALWDAAPGSVTSQILFGRERDLVFSENESLIHFVECTTSRTLAKAQGDSKKLAQLRDKFENAHLRSKLWFVTKDEPTADQADACRKERVVAVSLQTFRRQLLDPEKYLDLREDRPFGSAADPFNNESTDIRKVRWQETTLRVDGAKAPWSIVDVCNRLVAGGVVVLLGDFGVGKSLFIREVFRNLQARRSATNDGPIPVALNLREHWNQGAAAALRAHAESLGMDKPDRLVRALNAGRLIPLLDGFDELAAVTWNQRTPQKLAEARRASQKIVREFVDTCRGKCGLLVAGRESFFDPGEIQGGLSCRASDAFVHLDGFGEGEATAFLRYLGLHGTLPEWLPTRPLFLAHLAARGDLQEIIHGGTAASPAVAWDHLIDTACRREAKIHQNSWMPVI